MFSFVPRCHGDARSQKYTGATRLRGTNSGGGRSFAGLIGTLFPVLAVIILIALPAHSPLVFVFAVAFGTGMGIKTIVQATAAPEFLGRAGYGALQGALMLPVYIAQAVSPLLAAWIWQLHGNYHLLEIVLLVAAGVSAVAFVLAARLRPTPVMPPLVSA